MVKSMEKPKFKRVLIKLSGEALINKPINYGLDYKTLATVAKQLKEVKNLGIEVAVSVGGGNIFRGVDGTIRGMERAASDYQGMIATVINALALQDILEKMGVFTRVQTAIAMQEVAETYIRRRAIRHLDKGRLIIFAAGTGNPYFTTDTAAALRALEIGAEAILKATKVDGVYDEDPQVNPKAKIYKKLSYFDVLEKGLKIMDATAISLCMDNDLPIIVFNLAKSGNLKKVLLGKSIGTIISGGKRGDRGNN